MAKKSGWLEDGHNVQSTSSTGFFYCTRCKQVVYCPACVGYSMHEVKVLFCQKHKGWSIDVAGYDLFDQPCMVAPVFQQVKCEQSSLW